VLILPWHGKTDRTPRERGNPIRPWWPGTCWCCRLHGLDARSTRSPPPPGLPWPCRPWPSYRGHETRPREEDHTGSLPDGAWRNSFMVIWQPGTTATKPAVYRLRLKLWSRFPPRSGRIFTHTSTPLLAPGLATNPAPRAGWWPTCSCLTRSMASIASQVPRAYRAGKKVFSSGRAAACAGPPRVRRNVRPRPTTWPSGCGPPLTPSPPANARCSSCVLRGLSQSGDRQPLQLPLGTSKPNARQGLIRLRKTLVERFCCPSA